MMFGLAVLCFATVSMAQGEKIHERMSRQQLSEVFQKNHHSLVPEYEVVQFEILRRNRRDTGTPEAFTIRGFNGNVRVFLNPGPGILATRHTPVYRAWTSPYDGVTRYRLEPGAMQTVGDIFENVERGASFIVNKNSRGEYLVNGFIGSENLVVRSLPESVSNDLMQTATTTDKIEYSAKSPYTKSAYHVVFKRDEKKQGEELKKYRVKNYLNFEHRYGKVRKGSVLYPEVMVVVDNDLYKLHGNNLNRVLAYVVTFWNGVDLLYRSLHEPAIRFNIARIIVAMDLPSTPYIKNNTDSEGNVEANKAINGSATFYYQKLNYFPPSSFDAIVTMTSHMMKNGMNVANIVGAAKTGKICIIDEKLSAVLSVAIIKDDGSFQRVATAAHEFGHLFSMRHDGFNKTCDSNTGHIMGALALVTKNYHDFSSCSIGYLRNLIRKNGGSCLTNRPQGFNPVKRILPGQLLNRHQQCRALGFDRSCYEELIKDPNASGISRCRAIYCESRKEPCDKVFEVVAADGAVCDDGKFCLHGYCVAP